MSVKKVKRVRFRPEVSIEDIPLAMSTDDQDFDAEECDYLLNPSERSDVDYLRKHRRRMSCRRFFYLLLFGWCRWLGKRCCCREKELRSRMIVIGKPCLEKFPANSIRNQKYNIITFLPLVLFQQFKFFLNLYFLIMALSQFIPDLKLGYPYTYWGPLVFVLVVTMCREAVDDLRRYKRDLEVNSQKYSRIVPQISNGSITMTTQMVASSKLRVGDLIYIGKDERVPADLVLLRTTEKSGSCFVRTDQLDGETDWKLKVAVQHTQKLDSDQALLEISSFVEAEKPQRDIHSFIGKFIREDTNYEEGLDVENTLWANCVLASGSALGLVIYTGKETRSVMNNSQPRSKAGLLDIEINQLTKVLFVAVMGLALVMMVLKGFSGPWYKYLFRFVLLFSYIIPISLRVNLDMGKAFYSWQMQRDTEMPGCAVRCTTIPEELGRISYLLSDKTGTLTQNSMVFKRLHVASASYGQDTFDTVKDMIFKALERRRSGRESVRSMISTALMLETGSPIMFTRDKVTRVFEAVKAIAVCHNVTPVFSTGFLVESSGDERSPLESQSEVDQHYWGVSQSVTYQASSPDEVALVKWTEEVGLAVIKRDLASLQLKGINNTVYDFSILQLFPFTSESKRMGIIVREVGTGEITFYLKGADMVMCPIVEYTDWLEEECGNMAREGLRTLVVAKKILTEDQYHEFEIKYNSARMCMNSNERASRIASVIETLEREMVLVCVTGVEDKLQDNVKSTLELLRNAGIKTWMLTGDKLETAMCIAKSSKLISRSQDLFVIEPVKNRTEAHTQIHQFMKKPDSALVISGESLDVCLEYYQTELLEAACRSPAVICCRCTPTQKAQVVKLIQEHTGKRTAAIGDGGNDVSMIQAADCGIGIAGKEGRQASLAADFSINEFSHLSRLLLVHGRYSYKRSASLSQFVIHRGLIITTIQAIFSAVFYFSAVQLFPGYLMIGYATVYTMFPVFSLVLDQDVTDKMALTYPELYKELSKGRSLSFKTFFVWVLISIYQGGVVMYLALLLFEDELIHIVAISFTSLILTELIMVALTVRTWHIIIVLAELLSLSLYGLSLVVLRELFDPAFIQTKDFLWKVCIITLISCLPLYILKFLRKKYSPPSYSKLS